MIMSLVTYKAIGVVNIMIFCIDCETVKSVFSSFSEATLGVDYYTVIYAIWIFPPEITKSTRNLILVGLKYVVKQ